MQDTFYVTICRSAEEIIPYLDGLIHLEFVSGRHDGRPECMVRIGIINEVIQAFAKKRWYSILTSDSQSVAGFSVMCSMGEMEQGISIRGLSLADDPVLYIEQVTVDPQISSPVLKGYLLQAAEELATQLHYKTIVIQVRKEGPLLEALHKLQFINLIANVFIKRASSFLSSMSFANLAFTAAA